MSDGRRAPYCVAPARMLPMMLACFVLSFVTHSMRAEP